MPSAWPCILLYNVDVTCEIPRSDSLIVNVCIIYDYFRAHYYLAFYCFKIELRYLLAGGIMEIKVSCKKIGE